VTHPHLVTSSLLVFWLVLKENQAQLSQ